MPEGTPSRVGTTVWAALGPTSVTTSNTSAPSAASAVNHETQSNDAIAGNTPWVDTRPRVGFVPTMSHSAAGTRPEPAVSVPSARGTSPLATANAEPALEPPAMKRSSNGLRHTPYWGDRVPTSPVANWSRLVLPT